jgi:hypothetical protein
VPEPRARLALAQPAHMRHPVRHGQAGVPVRQAHAPAATWLARHQQRREVIPAAGGRQHLSPHSARVRPGGPATVRLPGQPGSPQSRKETTVRRPCASLPAGAGSRGPRG